MERFHINSDGSHNDVPPNALVEEQAYIGSLLIDHSKLDDEQCRLQRGEFYSPRHATIYDAIRARCDRGEDVDTVTVAEELGDKLDDCGGSAYLLECLQSAPHAEHCRTYAADIRDRAQRRRVIDAAREAERIARDPSQPLDELQDRIAPILNGKRSSARFAAARRLSEFPAQRIEWLWPGRLPLGKLTMLVGDPGLGKSFLTTDAAARITTGAPWPDQPLAPQPVGSVILFSAEDDPADTIRPRLEAAGGDPSKVVIVEGIADAAKRGERPRHFSIADDLPALDRLIKETTDARLVVIDPVSAYCGTMDSHKNTEVRAALAPLAELAARHRVAVLVVSHLNKAGGAKAIYRATGSLAFVAAARLAWLVAKDKDDPERRLMVPVKANIVASPTGLAFTINDGVIAWESDPITIHGDDVLADEVSDRDERSARTEAEAWLVEFLADGPALVAEVLKAAKSAGLTDKAVRTARERTCERPYREGFGREGKWYWRLRDTPIGAPARSIDALGAPSQSDGILGIYDGDEGIYDPFEGR